MAIKQVSSLSDADTRLAALNKEILQLETERSELLRAELANAESRVNEIESFIGVYNASSSLGGSSTRTAAKPGDVTKQRGRPGRKPGVSAKKPGRKPAAKPAQKAEAAPKPQRRKRMDAGERAALIKGLVKKAGKAGISARKLANENDISYGAVRTVLNDGKVYSKIGEKRDRRYFLK